VPATAIYTDYHAMLAKERLEIVSVATWPDVHSRLVIDIAKYRPKGIFCEKPITNTWGECKKMVAACKECGVKLGVHHQRRYGKPFRVAKELIGQGTIGKLLRVEFGAGNLFEYGSHNFDLSAYLAGCTKGKWAMGQIDYAQWNVVFDTHNENTALAYWEYANGVQGFAATGRCANFVGSHNRAVGSDGVIEMGPRDKDAEGKHLRYRARMAAHGRRYFSASSLSCGSRRFHMLVARVFRSASINPKLRWPSRSSVVLSPSWGCNSKITTEVTGRWVAPICPSRRSNLPGST
jgi:predicted dehydrogenase